MAMINNNLIRGILDTYAKPLDIAKQGVAQREQEKAVKEAEMRAKQLSNQQNIQTPGQTTPQTSPLVEQFRQLAQSGKQKVEQTTQGTTQDTTGMTQEDIYNQKAQANGEDLYQDTLTGRLKSTKEDFDKGSQEIVDRINSGEQGRLSGLVEYTGNVGRMIGSGIGDIATETLDLITPDKLREATGNAIYNTEYGKKIVDAGVEAIKAGGEAWNDFKSNNPNLAGYISGLAGVVEGVTSVTGAGTAGKVAAKTAGRAAAKVGELTAKGIGKGVEKVGGLTSGIGEENVSKLYKLAKEDSNILKSTKNIEDINRKVEDSIKQVKTEKSNLYKEDWKQFEEVSNNTPKVNISDFDTKFLQNALNDFPGLTGEVKNLKNGKIKFEINSKQSSLNDIDTKKLNYLFESIGDFVNSKNGKLNLVELDTLKSRINNAIKKASVTESYSPVEGLGAKYAKELDDIIKKNDTSGKYAEMNAKQTEFLNTLDDITKTLSQNNTSATMTKLTKLAQVGKGTTQYRTEMVKQLDELANTDLLGELAVLSSKDWIGRTGIGKIATGFAAGAGTLVNPAFLSGILLASPKVIGALAKTLGYSEAKLQKLGERFKKIKLNKKDIVGATVLSGQSMKSNEKSKEKQKIQGELKPKNNK